ncbi:S8 family serine peptidase [Tessaracoccus oleiagri]|uniref:Fn3-like domain-containing protein n=1 Tax=Tessaracoccus oleiagri TaxID=686624 RepID=A0A1G9KHB1_9ACTN|nr:S8 family serine peptidase [Tessaracoccus oleiagri]SDL49228.1 Fn3-like domain-containing protein [Tessaracoccus oleiagri]
MHSPTTRLRLRAMGAGLAAAALVATTGLAAVADDPDIKDLGSAADYGQAVEVPSIEEQLAHYKDAVVPGRWLVGLSISPGKLVSAAKAEGVDVRVVASFDKAWNGASVAVDDSQIHTVSRLAGVTGVYPVLEVTQPVLDEETTPAVEYAKQLTGAEYANNELGFTGEGIKVGIIDSGIDYNHPDFGGSGTNDQTKDFPGDRVVWGYDFVGDAYDASSDDAAVATPKPDQWPDDCGGHGTHVAGIVGANGEIQGVAPDVQFGSYRVFGCDGSSSSDIIVAAMDRAKADGMDIVNMSLGASYATWPSYPTAVAADNLVEDGVVVVVSQGNSGTGGIFSGGAPSVAHNVISVGSVDNSQFMAHYIATAGGLELPYFGATGAPDFEPGASFEIMAANPILGCSTAPPAPAAEEGLALLVSRGTCSFHEKAVNAQAAGYDALLIANNTTGVINATVEGATPITIPVATTLKTDGDALLAEINANGSTTITFSEDQKRFDNPTGGYQSDFSSYGLAADLTLKPDVSAPGGSIYSTYPLEEGGYASLGGTSMAAPHVAGAAALLLEAKPDLDPFEVRTALTNTADPFEWGLAAGAGYIEPVHRQGGGMIDIPQAITTAVTVEDSKISLGEGEAGPISTTLTVTNDSDEEKTFTLGAEHGIATYNKINSAGTPVMQFAIANADVVFSGDTVTVPARSTATVTVTIGEDFGMDGIIYGGWITLTSETEDFVVPFAGLSGDYQALETLTMAYTTYVDEDGVLQIAEPFHEYSMVDGDYPYIYFNLAYPVSGLYFDIYRANEDGTKGEKVHENFINYVTYLDQGRFAAAATLAWDGTYQGNAGRNGKVRRVENGDYILEVRILKALGDPNNPDHWESWDSTPITIAYGEGADTSAGNGPQPGRGGGSKRP